MVATCSASNCKNRFIKGGAVTFHMFPKDETKRMLWERNINRNNFKASKCSYLCSDHFLPECFDRNKLGGTWLKQNALPTIFNTTKIFKNKRNKNKRHLLTLANTANNSIASSDSNSINNSNHYSSDVSNQQNTVYFFNPIITNVNSVLQTNETLEKLPIPSDLTVLNSSTISTVIDSAQDANPSTNSIVIDSAQDTISKINEKDFNQLGTVCLSNEDDEERKRISFIKDFQVEDLQSPVEIARILHIVRKQDHTVQDATKELMNETASEQFDTVCLLNEKNMKRKRLSYIGDFQVEDLKSPVELARFLHLVKKQTKAKRKQTKSYRRTVQRLKEQVKVKNCQVNDLKQSVLRLKRQVFSLETLLAKEKHCSVCGFPNEKLQNTEYEQLKKDGTYEHINRSVLKTRCHHTYSKEPGIITKKNIRKKKLLTENIN